MLHKMQKNLKNVKMIRILIDQFRLWKNSIYSNPHLLRVITSTVKGHNDAAYFKPSQGSLSMQFDWGLFAFY